MDKKNLIWTHIIFPKRHYVDIGYNCEPGFQEISNLEENAGNSDKNKFEFTGRELEVLRLISEGKNNEEIAEKLFLSVRTVEKHLTNIYSKVGVSGKSARAYVASYAIKHNLILT